MATDEKLSFPNLFTVSNVDELNCALQNGVYINERNSYEETPLLCAVREDKSVRLIEEFIKRGADVDAKDCWGITPLYSTITKRGKDIKLIKLLLENGAEIKGGKPVNDRALDQVIMHNRPCAKLLIKYKFLKNYKFVKQPMLDEDSKHTRNYYLEYKEIVDLNIKSACYNSLAKFLDKCASDILRMQCVQLCNGQSLLEFVSSKMSFQRLETGAVKQITHQIFKELNFYPYLVYKGIIASRLGREYLVSKIEEQLFEMNKDASLNRHMNKACLNSDLMYHIAKYLCDEDLLNFVIAHLNLLLRT